jgi:hypothetical protein
MNVPVALKWAGPAFCALALAVGAGRVMYGCGQRSRDDHVAELSSQLAQSERTVKVKEGLYATKLVEMNDLRSLLDSSREEIKGLAEQLNDSEAKLLSTQEVAVRWKKAFEGAASAHQTDSGPSPTEPGVVRKRVDFSKDFGPIAVSGFTLTDPAEGTVSVRQTRPLLLTVNVVRDRDGKWASLVTSSEPTMEVGVRLGGVDAGVIPHPSWYQRFWLDMGTAELGDPAVSLGLSYRGDRFSLGASCFASSGTHGCGLTGGVRIGK